MFLPHTEPNLVAQILLVIRLTSGVTMLGWTDAAVHGRQSTAVIFELVTDLRFGAPAAPEALSCLTISRLARLV